MDCSLAALWTVHPWLDGVPNMKIFLHHVHKDVGLDAHSLVHLFAISMWMEVGSNPGHPFNSTRAASTSVMLMDWNLLLWDVKYTGHNFLHLCFGDSPVSPFHIRGRLAMVWTWTWPTVQGPVQWIFRPEPCGEVLVWELMEPEPRVQTLNLLAEPVMPWQSLVHAGTTTCHARITTFLALPTVTPAIHVSRCCATLRHGVRQL